jgi:tyrosine-protein kinase Etk/Wzc
VADTHKVGGEVEDNELNAREVFGVLVKWWRVIVFNCVAVGIIAVGVSMVLPFSYTATTTIMPPTEQGMSLGLSALLGAGGATAGIGGVARMAGLPGFGTTSDVFAGLLQTRSVMEKVVRRCNLLDHYGLDLLEEAIIALAGDTKIDVSFEGMVTLSFTASSPRLAADVANTYVAELDALNKRTTMTSGKAAKLFVEGRLREVKKDLLAAEESLKVFQERNKTIQLETEVTEAIKALAVLQAEVISRDVQLGILEQFATQDNPQVMSVAAEKKELAKRISELEYGLSSDEKGEPRGFGAGFGVPFARLPDVGMELARRIREVEIQNAVYTLMTQQYEEAKIMEARDTPTVQIVDVAAVPERRSFPVRKKIVAIGLMLGLLAGLSLAFALEYVDRLSWKPDEREKWSLLYRQLSSDLSLLRREIFKRRGR